MGCFCELENREEEMMKRIVRVINQMVSWT